MINSPCIPLANRKAITAIAFAGIYTITVLGQADHNPRMSFATTRILNKNIFGFWLAYGHSQSPGLLRKLMLHSFETMIDCPTTSKLP